MLVRKLDTTKRRDARAFIRFPFELYRDCPQWVPPLMPDMRAALNKKHYPFYRHSEADFFVAESEGQVLGRITALDNRRYNGYHGSRVAFFYHLELVEDDVERDPGGRFRRPGWRLAILYRAATVLGGHRLRGRIRECRLHLATVTPCSGSPG